MEARWRQRCRLDDGLRQARTEFLNRRTAVGFDRNRTAVFDLPALLPALLKAEKIYLKFRRSFPESGEGEGGFRSLSIPKRQELVFLLFVPWIENPADD